MVGNGTVTVTDDRFQKLVGRPGTIGAFHSFGGVGIDVGALPVHKRVISFFDKVPAAFAVHSEPAAHDGCNRSHAQFPAHGFGTPQEVRAGSRRGAVPVENGMNPDALQSVVTGHAQEGIEVVSMGVDAAVGEHSDEVQGGAGFLTVFHSVQVGRILKERTVGNGL